LRPGGGLSQMLRDHDPQFLFKRLVFVKMIPFNKNQTNSLNFRGSFNFHRALFRGIAIWVIKLL
jgi:hypothetical protein